jgi:hypothetical protein
MSFASGYQAPGSWNWPDNFDEPAQDIPSTSSSSSQEQPPGNSSTGDSTRAGSGTRPGRTHWPPRQCRICLETVLPTFNAASESLPAFLQSSNVVYTDETGRLIRPCMCKGSSKYVHDACLQAWRHADPGYARRNYWQCPTCGFKYRLARLGTGRFIGSIGKFSDFRCDIPGLTGWAGAQIALTALILILVIFFLGFVADPIIGLYVDPWSYMPWNSHSMPLFEDDEPSTWYEHFAKGFASMGVLGFLKVLVANPFSYFRFGGSGRGRNTGRDRVEQVSWIIIVFGVGTFLAVSANPGTDEEALLTQNRRSTKEFAFGVVAHSNELANESWTSRTTTTMTTSS